jgi:hypothetical protein
MDIQDVLEEAEKIAAYMNADVPDTMGYENMKTLLDAYFEKNSSILELGNDSLRDSCMFCNCKSHSECHCECHIYLDVRGKELHVVISTRDMLDYEGGPQENRFGGCYIYKKDAHFFVTSIFDDHCHDVWHREYNYDDYWFEEP